MQTLALQVVSRASARMFPGHPQPIEAARELVSLCGNGQLDGSFSAIDARAKTAAHAKTTVQVDTFGHAAHAGTVAHAETASGLASLQQGAGFVPKDILLPLPASASPALRSLMLRLRRGSPDSLRSDKITPDHVPSCQITPDRITSRQIMPDHASSSVAAGAAARGVQGVGVSIEEVRAARHVVSSWAKSSRPLKQPAHLLHVCGG